MLLSIVYPGVTAKLLTFVNLSGNPGGSPGAPLTVAPDHFTRIGNKLIFEAADPVIGRQLFITDGATVSLLEDIDPSGNAFPVTDVNFANADTAATLQPVLFNGFVYLPAND